MVCVCVCLCKCAFLPSVLHALILWCAIRMQNDHSWNLKIILKKKVHKKTLLPVGSVLISPLLDNDMRNNNNIVHWENQLLLDGPKESSVGIQKENFWPKVFPTR